MEVSQMSSNRLFGSQVVEIRSRNPQAALFSGPAGRTAAPFLYRSEVLGKGLIA
jgi:hypothetical protein